MLSLTDYLADPCGALSIPYWKAASITMPENMAVIHDRQFPSEHSAYRSHERYFRLFHNLRTISQTTPDFVRLVTARESDLETIVSVINQCYPDIQVDHAQIAGCRRTAVFDPALWVLAVHEDSDVCAGCGIADLDPQAGELSLEWIQVLPQFRGQGIGQAIVNELLRRGAGKARFATVSGRADGSPAPERLYRSCGFTGDDIWHICQE